MITLTVILIIIFCIYFSCKDNLSAKRDKEYYEGHPELLEERSFKRSPQATQLGIFQSKEYELQVFNYSNRQLTIKMMSGKIFSGMLENMSVKFHAATNPPSMCSCEVEENGAKLTIMHNSKAFAEEDWLIIYAYLSNAGTVYNLPELEAVVEYSKKSAKDKQIEQGAKIALSIIKAVIKLSK